MSPSGIGPMRGMARSDLTSSRSKDRPNLHEHFATVNYQPCEVPRTFNNAIFRAFEDFRTREAIHLCRLSLDGSRALAPFGRPLRNGIVKLSAVTLDEDSNGREF